MDDSKKGVPFMVLSALWFSLTQMGVKLCGDGIPTMEKILFRCLISAAITYPIARSRMKHVFGLPSQQGFLIVRSVCGIASDYLFFLAAMTGMQAVVFLRERLTLLQVLSLIVALIGAWIICFKVRLLHQENTTIFKKCSQKCSQITIKPCFCKIVN